MLGWKYCWRIYSCLDVTRNQLENKILSDLIVQWSIITWLKNIEISIADLFTPKVAIRLKPLEWGADEARTKWFKDDSKWFRDVCEMSEWCNCNHSLRYLKFEEFVVGNDILCADVKGIFSLGYFIYLSRHDLKLNNSLLGLRCKSCLQRTLYWRMRSCIGWFWRWLKISIDDYIYCMIWNVWQV